MRDEPEKPKRKPRPKKPRRYNRKGEKVINHPGEGGYSDAMWAEARSLWIAGAMRKTDIAKKVGISRAAIYEKAALEGWADEKNVETIKGLRKELYDTGDKAVEAYKERMMQIGKVTSDVGAFDLVEKDPKTGKRIRVAKSQDEATRTLKAGTGIMADVLGLRKPGVAVQVGVGISQEQHEKEQREGGLLAALLRDGKITREDALDYGLGNEQEEEG